MTGLDGSSRFKIADENPRDLDLSFSPDGKKVVYELGYSLYIINADGSGIKNLTPDWNFARHPAFFPDGAKIAFTGSEPGGYATNIWTVDVDGSNLKSFKATYGMYFWDLVVSPTGDSFLFQGIYAGYAPVDYFVVNADGSGLVRLPKKGDFPDD